MLRVKDSIGLVYWHKDSKAGDKRNMMKIIKNVHEFAGTQHSFNFEVKQVNKVRNYSIEHFHVTSLPPCWRAKTIHFLL